MQRRKQSPTTTPSMMKRVGGGYVLRKTPITPPEPVQPKPISEMAKLKSKNQQLSRLVTGMKAKLENATKEIVHLKKTNEDLSCLLADTTKKHSEAAEYIVSANNTIQSLKVQLETHKSRNMLYQIELAEAVKEKEEGRQELTKWVQEHQQAKADMVETRSRLEALKTFMETAEVARYYQSDEKLLATDLVDNDNDNENDTFKEKVPHTPAYGYSLEDSYMEENASNHEISTDECTYSQDSSTGLYASSQCSFTEECIYSLDRNEGAAALQEQVYTLNETIDSLQRKVNVLEDNLETCEFEKEILQMQLDRLSRKDT